jgi:hypothetical protein
MLAEISAAVEQAILDAGREPITVWAARIASVSSASCLTRRRANMPARLRHRLASKGLAAVDL